MYVVNLALVYMSCPIVVDNNTITLDYDNIVY